MSLFKRKKNGKEIETWYYLFYINGKRYYGSTKTKNLKEAGRIEARKRVAAERGESLTSHKPPMLRDFATKFLEFIEQSRLEKGSKTNYKQGWKLLKHSKLAGMRLDHITRDDCDTTRFYVFPKRLKNCTEEAVPYESPYSTNCAIRTLSRMLHKAKDWQLIREVPKLKLVEAPPRTAMFTPEIEMQLLGACPQPLHDAVLVVLDTGMRNGSEVLSMRWEYVNFAGCYYHNPKGKSERARRVVPLSERVTEALRARNPQLQGWVFASDKSRSGHVELRKLQIRFRKICRKLGIPDELKIYCGRHTFGTTTMNKTGDPALVMKTMGHADLRSTLPYLHPKVGIIKAVIDQRNREKEAGLAGMPAGSEMIN